MRGARVHSDLIADLGLPVSRETQQIGNTIADAFGSSSLAVLHYGSRLHASSAPTDSAFDFFVIVESTRAALESFEQRQRPRVSARAATMMARVLAPSVIGVRAPGAAPHGAKCVVLTLADLTCACGAASDDHFVKGRVVQPMRLVWRRDEYARAAVQNCLVEARAGTFYWLRPRLTDVFDVAAYCACMLETSYRSEIRLESSARAAAVTAAHGPSLHELYAPLLERLHADGELARDGESFRLLHAVTKAERWRVRRYLARSKVRGVLRWPKSALLYDHWFQYVSRKARRMVSAKGAR